MTCFESTPTWLKILTAFCPDLTVPVVTLRAVDDGEDCVGCAVVTLGGDCCGAAEVGRGRVTALRVCRAVVNGVAADDVASTGCGCPGVIGVIRLVNVVV